MSIDVNYRKARNEMRKDDSGEETKYQNSRKLISEYLGECLHHFTSPEHPDHHCPGCCKCECCADHPNRYLKAYNRYYDSRRRSKRQYKNNGWRDYLPTREEALKDIICTALGLKLYSMCMVAAGETPDEEWIEWAKRLYNDPQQYVESEIEDKGALVSEARDMATEFIETNRIESLPPGMSSQTASYMCGLASSYAGVKCRSFRLKYLRDFREFMNWFAPT